MKYPWSTASITVRPVSGLIILESRFFIPQSMLSSLERCCGGNGILRFLPFWTEQKLQSGKNSQRVVKRSKNRYCASETRYLNEESEATKSLYRNRAAHLVTEQAVYERGL